MFVEILIDRASYVLRLLDASGFHQGLELRGLLFGKMDVDASHDGNVSRL
jgi:hypothetical protein